jgi:hypothetical protein
VSGNAQLPPEVQERNRELVAERLGWPDGAIEACRKVEAAHPGWYSWWSPNPWPPRDGPAYGAARINARWNDPTLYADTPEELAELIEAAQKGAQR